MTMQQKLVKNNWFRLAVSVILTLAVVVVFVCAPFSTAHAIAGVDDAAIIIILAALASCGITFASTGAFNAVQDFIESQVETYCNENAITTNQFFAGSDSATNKLGQILLNNRFVLMVDTFARWLVAKYNLADNTTITVIADGTTYNGLTGYSLPVAWSSGTYNYEWSIVTSELPVLMFFLYNANTGPSTAQAKFFSDYQATIHRRSYNQYGESTHNYTLTVDSTTSFNYHYYASDGVGTSGLATYDWNTFYAAFPKNDPVIDEQVNIGINVGTGTIDYPVDNPNYTTGDGAILDVGSTWGRPYTGVVYGDIPTIWPNVVAGTQTPAITYEPEGTIEEQVPEQADIENLPGGSWFGLPVGFEGLRLSSIWHYVVQWINDTANAGGLLWNTASAMPSPVVNMVFAMVVVAIVFGVLKSLRAH